MSKKTKHIQQILGQIWCLSPVHFEQFVQDLEGQDKHLAEQTLIDKFMAMWSWNDKEAAMAQAESKNYEIVEYEGKMFALIRIEGVLVKTADYWDKTYGGMFGTAELLPVIDEIESETSLSGLLLVFNSPGGSVAGIEALADRLYSFSKTSVALVDEMCCSGAYWLAAQTNKIISLGKTAEVGSIGVVAKHRDYSERNKAEGLKVSYLTADGSPDKALGNPDEALSEAARQAMIERLNPVYDQFVAQVRKSRRTVNTQAFTGKIYLAEQALELGLIDQIGSQETALAFLSKKTTNANFYSKSMSNVQNPAPQVEAQAAQVVPPANDHNALFAQLLTQITAQMTDMKVEFGAFKTDLQATKTANADLQTKLAQAEQTAQTAQIQAQKAEAAKADAEKKLDETPVPPAQIASFDPKVLEGTVFGLAIKKEGFDAVQKRYAEYAEQPWNKRPN